MLSVIRTGLDAAMQEISVISNNVANASATAFKRSRTEFSDIYTVATEQAAGSELGLGTRKLDPRRLHEQGGLRETGNALDVAINGNGMFVVQNMENENDIKFTRDGSINLRLNGRLETDEGYAYLDVNQEEIFIPFNVVRPDGTNGILTEIKVKANGVIAASYGPQYNVELAQLGLARFENEPELKSEGRNFFVETPLSGAPSIEQALVRDNGYFQAGALEMSNVDITDEMSMMLRAQQAYNGSSRLMQSEADMIRRLLG